MRRNTSLVLVGLALAAGLSARVGAAQSRPAAHRLFADLLDRRRRRPAGNRVCDWPGRRRLPLDRRRRRAAPLRRAAFHPLGRAERRRAPEIVRVRAVRRPRRQPVGGVRRRRRRSPAARRTDRRRPAARDARLDHRPRRRRPRRDLGGQRRRAVPVARRRMAEADAGLGRTTAWHPPSVRRSPRSALRRNQPRACFDSSRKRTPSSGSRPVTRGESAKTPAAASGSPISSRDSGGSRSRRRRRGRSRAPAIG